MNEGVTNREPSTGTGKPGKAATIFRAATAIVVFGIPLLMGTVAVAGYCAHEVYKKMKGRKS